MKTRLSPTRAFAYAYLGLIGAFLYSPLATLVLMSFSSSKFLDFPVRSATVDWYVKALQNGDLLWAGLVSVTIASVVSAIAGGIGTLFAFGLVRYDFAAKPLIRGAVLVPLVLPPVVMGASLLGILVRIGLGLSLVSVIIGHTVMIVPYVILVVSARLEAFDRSLEEAALNLGAPPIVAFRRITLPLIRPGIITAMVFAFALSLDEFMVAYFLAPPGFRTLPLQIFSMIKDAFTPEINAISTLLILFAILVVIGVTRLERVTR